MESAAASHHEPVRNAGAAPASRVRRCVELPVVLVGVRTGNTEGVAGPAASFCSRARCADAATHHPDGRLEATSRSPESAPSWATTLPRLSWPLPSSERCSSAATVLCARRCTLSNADSDDLGSNHVSPILVELPWFTSCLLEGKDSGNSPLCIKGIQLNTHYF